MTEQTKEGVYSLDSLPADFTPNKQKEFKPLEAGMYQVEVKNLEIKRKPEMYIEEGKNPYNVNASLVVIEKGENYGRYVWDNLSPAVYPTSKKGPSKLYKLITAVLGHSLDSQQSSAYQSSESFAKNLKELIGKQLIVMVDRSQSETGKIRNKVLSYTTVKNQLNAYVEPTKDNTPVQPSLTDEDRVKLDDILKQDIDPNDLTD